MSTREERSAAVEALLRAPKAHQEQVDARRRHNEKKAALKLADAALLDKVWDVISESFDALQVAGDIRQAGSREHEDKESRGHSLESRPELDDIGPGRFYENQATGRRGVVTSAIRADSP